LAGQVLRGGLAEVGKFIGFLKSGGSKYPIETLRDAGVDMESPEPIESALKHFGKRVQELRALTIG
jgi:oligoendopeptidase F